MKPYHLGHPALTFMMTAKFIGTTSGYSGPRYVYQLQCGHHAELARPRGTWSHVFCPDCCELWANAPEDPTPSVPTLDTDQQTYLFPTPTKPIGGIKSN